MSALEIRYVSIHDYVRCIRAAVAIGLILLLSAGVSANAQPTLVERMVVDPEVLAAALPDSLDGVLVRKSATIRRTRVDDGLHAVSVVRIATSSANNEGAWVIVRMHSYPSPGLAQRQAEEERAAEINEWQEQGFRVWFTRGGRSSSETHWRAWIDLADSCQLSAGAESEARLHDVLGRIDLHRIASAIADSTILLDPQTDRIFESVEAFERFKTATAPRVVNLVPRERLESLLPDPPQGHRRQGASPLEYSISRSVDGQWASGVALSTIAFVGEDGDNQPQVRLVLEDVEAIPGRSAQVLAARRRERRPVTEVRGYPALLQVDTLASAVFARGDSFLVVLVGDRRLVAMNRSRTALARMLLDSLDLDALAALIPERQALSGLARWSGSEMDRVDWYRFSGPWQPDPSHPSWIVIEPRLWPIDFGRRGPLMFTLPENWSYANPLGAACGGAGAEVPLVLLVNAEPDPCSEEYMPEPALLQPHIILYEVEYGRLVPMEWLEHWQGYALSKLPRWMHRQGEQFTLRGVPRRDQVGENAVIWLGLDGPDGVLRALAGFVEIDGAMYLGLAIGAADQVDHVFGALNDVLATLSAGP